ncbi:hypothetical protein [Novosphingobium sp. KN65.2]|uniref:hypothetical protein n=1 Tax=Novosphingobium sp. KN65.2 TaxID=1478134 RepID=UPI0005DE2023|nr:hypothetical protein [Novosphingobium sp. KN65.2]CDO37983.1 putative Type Four secretion pathway protein AvhB7 [Novosphingobium sp. KN65.2]
MKSLIFTALGALALSGCTGTRISPPAVCDGKHRRPANMYGTVLPDLPVPLPPSEGNASAIATPPNARNAAPAMSSTPPASAKLSAHDKREIALSYRPC